MAGQILYVASGGLTGTEISVDGEFLIGRSATGHGRLAGDPELSRRHARIVVDDRGALVVEDLQSTNGTFVGGSKLEQPRTLSAGDVIKVGRTHLEVRGVSEEPALVDGDAPVQASPVAEAAVPPRRAQNEAPATGDERADSKRFVSATPVEQSGAPSSIQKLPSLTPGTTAEPAELLFEGRRVPVPVGGLSIGRHPSSDLVVESSQASRLHARIESREGRYYVADIGTVNGTLLNGELLRASSRWLTPGDTITVGEEPLRFLTGQRTRIGEIARPAFGPKTVQLEGRQLTIGRDAANGLVLEDPNVSRFHAEVMVDESGARLRDLGSRNGTRLDGAPTTQAHLRTGSEVGIGPYRLVFDGKSFLQRDDRGALRLNAEALSVAVRGKTILNRASLAVEPGEFVVIIGESGSGKTTLIKALAGVATPTNGAVTVNSDPVSSRLTDIGYVPQDEIVHPHLSVREALGYAAKLRLPPDSSEGDREAAVERVLVELSLREHADTRIEALSGGQRKRAGMAAELLSRPSLLFLDEPTTGLDPGLETRMMELFDHLAEEGTRAMTVVTHATKNLNLADKVCVMGRGGELAFYGSPAEAKEFFGVDDYDGIYTALEQRGAREWRQRYESLRALDVQTAAADEVQARTPTAPPVPPRRRVGRQASVLAQRYFKLLTRDRRNLLILLGQAPLIAIGVALIFRAGVLDGPGTGRPADAAQLLFLLAITCIWLGSIDSSREIIKERALAVREAAVGVKPSAYLFSKAAVLFGLAGIQALIVAAVVFAIRPLDASTTAYLAVLGTLVLTAWVAVAMGLLVSSIVETEDQATSFIPLVLIPQLLFAGAIVAVDAMGQPMAALSNLAFARWSFATLGAAIDMNDRIEADEEFSTANEYGPDFFNLFIADGLSVLLGFLILFLGAVWLLVRRREA